MWWNERFTSWMCSWQICSSCVMLSYQYGPKYLRNVSNTLLNQCHQELRQFWRQNGFQLDISKVYLIKWPVSEYFCTNNNKLSSDELICHIHNYTEYNEEWNVFSAFNPSKHTQTWSSGQPTLQCPGSSQGFCALLKGLNSAVDTSCQSWDSNPQPWVTSGFKSTHYPLGHDCLKSACSV